jgi:hypothetical protein
VTSDAKDGGPLVYELSHAEILRLFARLEVAEAVAKACADISAYGYRVCAICHATGGKHVDCPLPAYLATVGR